MGVKNKVIIYADPYKLLYEKYGLPEDEEIKIELDAKNASIVYEEKAILEFFNNQLSDAKQHKSKWISEAMKYDPAFMLDPVEEYYKPYIRSLLSEGMYDQLSEKEQLEILALYDPVTWGELYLFKNHSGWKPRVSKLSLPYQSQIIRCKSKRQVVRAGRRLGKSLALVVKILHRAFTWTETKSKSTYSIVIFTPNQSQLNTIFKMMEVLIDNNKLLLDEIKEGGKIPTRKNPNPELEFKNGVTIKGFVSGSTAVRSSAADFLVLDEASFLGIEDVDAVIALIAENKDVELWISSTPKGLKDYFYERVHDQNFVSFHFPSDKFHPFWDKQMETELRSQYSEAGYQHEALAEFSADGEGVFQIPFIDAAKVDYNYEDQFYNPKWFYGIGVDWNDEANGTQIYVIGFDPERQKYRIVDKSAVSVEGWTQTTAVRRVKELNRKWHPVVIYLDYGHGATQEELLHEIGMRAQFNSVDRMLLKAKSINFSSAFEIRDPWTKQKVKKPAKPYLVNNAVRVIEGLNIEISSSDTVLIKQLEGYRIDHYTPNGIPVYAKDPKYGDHSLDAVMLGLLGFHREFSTLVKPKMKETVGTLAPSDPNKNTVTDPFFNHGQHDADRRLAIDKAKEKEEYLAAHGIDGRNAGLMGPRRNPSVGLGIVRQRTLPPRNSRSF